MVKSSWIEFHKSWKSMPNTWAKMSEFNINIERTEWQQNKWLKMDPRELISTQVHNTLMNGLHKKNTQAEEGSESIWVLWAGRHRLGCSSSSCTVSLWLSLRHLTLEEHSLAFRVKVHLAPSTSVGSNTPQRYAFCRDQNGGWDGW